MRDNTITFRRSERIRNRQPPQSIPEVQSFPPKVVYKRTRKNPEETKVPEEQKVFKASREENRPRKRIRKETQEDSSKRVKGTFFTIPKTEVPKGTEDPKGTEVDWSEWVAATATKNYMMNDGFLDVLQNQSSNVIKANPNYCKDIGKMIGAANNNTNFVASLLSCGNVFESKVVDLLKNILGENNTINISGNHDARSFEKYQDTIKAIQKGIPIIFEAVLRNYKNKTYGVADILIRSDWINSFLDVNALSSAESVVPSPKLNQKYHYVVIDVKYKCLQLRSDGIHLRNDDNLKSYKSQLFIYTDALTEIQGYTPPYAFILGSKWKFTCKGQDYEGKTCFERLGRIDYANLDIDYIEKTELAVKWVKDVRQNNYDLSKYPLERDELYPNMCNRHDFPYHEIKRKFAETNKDLTLLWYVGPEQRRIANSNGVYSWDDPKCTPEILGVNGQFRSKVLGRILEANHSETNTIIPKYIQNNFGDWKNEKFEIFVDFETTCPVFNNLEDLPSNEGVSLIFLIGAGYIDPKTKKWTFHKFVVNEINEAEETRICNEFVQFINSLAEQFQIKDEIQLWHWSHAEVSSWNHFEDRNSLGFDMGWTDMLKIFLEEPIGIKGCLNFSLKNVAKNFYHHGFIKTTWKENSNCVDGADAAVGAYRANLECINKNKSFASHSLVKEIIKYNEVDCRVLQEILSYLRNNHSHS